MGVLGFAAVGLLKSERKYAWMKMSPAVAAAILAKPYATADKVLKAAQSWKFSSRNIPLAITKLTDHVYHGKQKKSV